MTVRSTRINVRTTERTTTADITSGVRDWVKRAGVATGVCVVATQHTTTGVFVNENDDRAVQQDLLAHLATLVPASDEFRHASLNADAHIKAVLTGSSVTLSVKDGDLDLGTWQGIYLAEYDGPRERHVIVTVLGD